MMKIQIEQLDGQMVLRVEGRLAGACVPELEDCWKTARAGQPAPKISVDLKNVTCVDRAGRALLRSMHGNGVVFLRAGMAIQDILDQITQHVGQALSPADR
jgi:anti-anti-sigma regulatory factor